MEGGEITLYNPWRRFALFYLGAILFTAANYLAGGLEMYNGSIYTIAFLFLGVPFVIPFFMIFTKKKVIGLPLETLGIAVFLSYLTYWVALIIACIFLYFIERKDGEVLVDTDEFLVGLGVVYVIGSMISMLIILPIVHRLQKKANFARQ